MAFVISKKTTFSWPITVRLPNAGKFEKQNFTAVFQKLSQLEIQEKLSKLADSELSPTQRFEMESEFLNEVLVGWEGIKNEQDEPFTFSEEHRDILLEIVEVRRGLFDAFFDATLNRRAEAKN